MKEALKPWQQFLHYALQMISYNKTSGKLLVPWPLQPEKQIKNEANISCPISTSFSNSLKSIDQFRKGTQH